MRVRHLPPRLALLLVVAALLGLSACGKRGSPTAPGPTNEIIYPHTYPKM